MASQGEYKYNLKLYIDWLGFKIFELKFYKDTYKWKFSLLGFWLRIKVYGNVLYTIILPTNYSLINVTSPLFANSKKFRGVNLNITSLYKIDVSKILSTIFH